MPHPPWHFGSLRAANFGVGGDATQNVIWCIENEKINAINASLRRLDDGNRVRFLDFGPKLIGPDGELLASHVPDGLHLVGPGYEAWAEAMAPLLTEMMG